METRTYTVRKFTELSDELKEKVLERYRNINVENESDADFVTDEWTAKLKELGYEDARIFYSGFWSQGDGACFEANINIAQYIKAHKLSKQYPLVKKYAEYIRASLKHSGHYYHSTMTSLSFEISYSVADEGGKWDAIDSQIAELESVILSDRKALGNEIYQELEKNYNELTSNASVIDTLEANDYDFTEEGKID